MKGNAVFGTIVIIAWVWLSILIADKVFPQDSIAELIILICCTSIGIFLAFSMEYLVLRLKQLRPAKGETKE